jgi:hypothetical protein
MFGRSFLGGTGGGSTGALVEGEEQLKEIIAKRKLIGKFTILHVRATRRVV